MSLNTGALFTGVGVGVGLAIGVGDSLGVGNVNEGFEEGVLFSTIFAHLGFALAEGRAQIKFCPEVNLTIPPTSRFLQN